MPCYELSKWPSYFQASPGNLTQFEEILFSNSDMSNSVGVIAVKLTTDNGQRVRTQRYVYHTQDFLLFHIEVNAKRNTNV